jgi:hypothetical protein
MQASRINPSAILMGIQLTMPSGDGARFASTIFVNATNPQKRFPAVSKLGRK